MAWSEGSYTSEFAPDGRVAQEAMFESLRYNSYRTYKANFIGKPNSRPTLQTIASSSNGEAVSTTSYVSWNGATEVSRWEFSGSNEQDGKYKHLGRIARTGFETSFISHSACRYTRVRAIDEYDRVLGESHIMETLYSTTTSTTTTTGSLISNPDSAAVKSFQRFKRVLLALSTIVFILVLIFIVKNVGTTCRPLHRLFHRSNSNPHGYMLVNQETQNQT